MASNWRDCVAFALNRPLRAGEDRKLEQRFETERQRRLYVGEAADDASVASGIARAIEAELAIAKRNVYLNRIAWDALRNYDPRFGNKALAVEAKLVGINEAIPGGRDSVAAKHFAIKEQYWGGLIADLRKAGQDAGADLIKLMGTRDMELPLRKELRGEASGDPLAAAIGKVVNKWFDAARQRENRAGSWIGKLEDYGGGQSHDPRKVYRAGGKTPKTPTERDAAFDSWRAFVQPILDTARTYPDVATHINPEPFLRQIWDAISANLHETVSGGEFTGLHKFIGPANLGKQASESRVLHFRNAEAAQAYNDKFGHGSLMEAIAGRLDRSARNTALMEELGPNAEANLDRWRRDLAKEAQGKSDPKAAGKLKGRRLDNFFAEVTGRTNAINPGGVDLAYWGSALRALESMSKLGAATLSSFGDIATLGAELRYQGRGYLQSWHDALTGFFRGRGKGETRIIADLLGVGLEGIIGGVHARFHVGDAPLGRMSRLMQQMFRFNLLNWWTDTHKTTAGLMTARYMALEAPKTWENIHPDTARLLTQYGIDRDGWNVMRKAGVAKGEDGTEFLTPAAIRDLPVMDFAAVAGKRYRDLGLNTRAVEDARDRLATAYQALVTDRAEFAIPTPGARERAMMIQGTERGTVLGEALRFVMQFKAFPLAMISRVMGREYYGTGGGYGAIFRMGELIAELTAMGYLSMTAKDLARGKEAADPANVNTFYRAMTQGGGLGIYGDFILGEHDRFGRSPAETALGPAFGTAGDVVKLVNKAVRGDFSSADFLRFGVQNAPFLNLFYVRPVLDYAVLNPIYESLKPGYLNRLQRDSEKRYGQGYWWS